MKKAICIYCSILLFFTACANKTKIDNIDYIFITSNYWDHEYTNLISYNDSVIKRVIEQNEIYANKLQADEFIVNRQVMSKKALEHLCEYIRENCNEDPPKVTNHYPVYTVVIRNANKKDISKCYYYAKDLGLTLNYFKNMIKWIEQSEYRAEYGKLLKSLNSTIERVNEAQKIEY